MPSPRHLLLIAGTAPVLFLGAACASRTAVAERLRAMERLRGEVASREKALRATQASIEELLERLDTAEAEAERVAARREDLAMRLADAEAEIRWLEAERDDYRGIIDELERQYGRVLREREVLAAETARLAEELRVLEEEFARLRRHGRSAARPGDPLAGDEAPAGSASVPPDLAVPLRRLRELERRILDEAAARAAGPRPFDAGAPPGEADPGRWHRLYREDPGGLWHEVAGFVRSRLESLFRGGARWDAWDIGLFGGVVAVFFLAVRALGAPLRWLRRRWLLRELYALRRRVRELEARGETTRPPPAARVELPRRPPAPADAGVSRGAETSSGVRAALDRALPDGPEGTRDSGPDEEAPAGTEDRGGHPLEDAVRTETQKLAATTLLSGIDEAGLDPGETGAAGRSPRAGSGDGPEGTAAGGPAPTAVDAPEADAPPEADAQEAGAGGATPSAEPRAVRSAGTRAGETTGRRAAPDPAGDATRGDRAGESGRSGGGERAGATRDVARDPRLEGTDAAAPREGTVRIEPDGGGGQEPPDPGDAGASSAGVASSTGEDGGAERGAADTDLLDGGETGRLEPVVHDPAGRAALGPDPAGLEHPAGSRGEADTAGPGEAEGKEEPSGETGTRSIPDPGEPEGASGETGTQSLPEPREPEGASGEPGTQCIPDPGEPGGVSGEPDTETLLPVVQDEGIRSSRPEPAPTGPEGAGRTDRAAPPAGVPAGGGTRPPAPAEGAAPGEPGPGAEPPAELAGSDGPTPETPGAGEGAGGIRGEEPPPPAPPEKRRSRRHDGPRTGHTELLEELDELIGERFEPRAGR